MVVRTLAVVGFFLVLALGLSRLDCALRREMLTTKKSYLTACERSCRRELSSDPDQCRELCACSSEQLRGGRSEAEYARWIAANGARLTSSEELRQTNLRHLPACGREMIRAQLFEGCEQQCASNKGSCPPGFCRCLADAMVADARFSDPKWLMATLGASTTERTTDWGKELAPKCLGQEAAPAPARP
jgi:hypothetical protein